LALRKQFMSDILKRTIVLVLNRNWQAINIRTPQDAFCQMATNAATALDIELGDGGRTQALRPVTWDEWITLPVRDGDHAVRTARGAIRVPTVIVAVNFAKVPKKRPKLSAKNIRERDGNRCQYTGRLLLPAEGNLDHVVPRSRGGADKRPALVIASGCAGLFCGSLASRQWRCEGSRARRWYRFDKNMIHCACCHTDRQ
jgi:hypothetical protein